MAAHPDLKWLFERETCFALGKRRPTHRKDLPLSPSCAVATVWTVASSVLGPMVPSELHVGRLRKAGVVSTAGTSGERFVELVALEAQSRLNLPVMAVLGVRV